MNLQPKTRKYRVSFRNKTEKKCNLSKSFKQKNINTPQYISTPDYKVLKSKVNFTDNVSLISTTYKSSRDFSSVANLQIVNSTYFNDKNTSGTLLIEKIHESREQNKVLELQNLSDRLPLKMAWSVDSQNINNNSNAFKLVNAYWDRENVISYDLRNRTSKIENRLTTFDCVENRKFSVYAENAENNKRFTVSHNLLENQASAHTCATLDKLSFGQCGIYFCNTGTITAKFIEMARLAVARKLKKSGRFWIRLCPDTPVTVRSAETRMGRGKGGISHYSAKIRAGQVFMEFCGVSEENISKIYQELKKKAPLPIKLVY